MTLDQRAEDAAVEFRGLKSRHKARKHKWLELRALRTRAIRATNRRAKASGELPLFAKRAA